MRVFLLVRDPGTRDIFTTEMGEGESFSVVEILGCSLPLRDVEAVLLGIFKAKVWSFFIYW